MIDVASYLARSWGIHWGFVFFCLIQLVLLSYPQIGVASDLSAKEISIGVNKFDLFMQYTGTASGGDGGAAYRRVTRAMAKKALDDAKDAGVRYVRVFMGGRTSFTPRDGRDSLALWRTDPEAFWRQVDEMMDDLDAREIQLIPVLVSASGKFQIMTGEPLGEMFRNPNSRSWILAARFVTDFVTRYHKRRTVLFYELTNELNNFVDLDLERRCQQKKKEVCNEEERFTVEDLIAYTTRLANLIRNLDRTRLISSGFSIPRGAAEHLRARPQWSAQGADWRADTREQFAKNLKDIHVGVDIISIHLFGGVRNQRFGSTDAVDLLAEAKRVADEIGKPLFVGEFGDHNPRDADDRSFSVRMMTKILELRIPYSALWVWEFYPNTTYATHDNRHSAYSLEPGYTDFLIARLREANGKNGTKGKDISPPRVVLTWPLECSVLSEPIELYAVASDDSGRAKKVEFLVDGKIVNVDETPPYQARFLPAMFSAGRHQLTARAHDFGGNVAEFSSVVIVGRRDGRAEGCTISTK